jgi:hypothetical protein
MPVNDDARALAETLIASGREPLWCMLVVGWHYGERGREAALSVIEERELQEGARELRTMALRG